MLERVGRDAREAWRVDRFVVVDRRCFRTWWGSDRSVVVADVGWQLARLSLVVRDRDAKVIESAISAYPTARELLAELTEQQVLGIAMRECRRHNSAIIGDTAVRKRSGLWYVRTNNGWLGSCASFVIDDRTGVIIQQHYARR